MSASPGRRQILFGSQKCRKWRWKKKISMIQQEHFEKISLQKLKIRMSASPGRRQRRLRLSKRLIGKLCSGLCNILQSAEIRIDCGMNFWLERVATARRWCRLSYSNDSNGERGGKGVKGMHNLGKGRLLCATPSMLNYFCTVNILRLSCAKRAIIFLRVNFQGIFYFWKWIFLQFQKFLETVLQDLAIIL